ncbi:hypothetical protein ABZX62_00195 [Streptomyces flavidovirens]|uniref:hypothetical protein n=1 Tax=Streptomyces flavidovirens TaxID=67298 RepID=UPI0033BC5CDD
MTEPRLIPPPPNYPPSAGAYKTVPEPRIIVVTPETEAVEKAGFLASLRPVRNVTALGAALAPVFDGYSLATSAGTVLHEIVQDGHPSGAWTIDIAVLAITAHLDHSRDGWVYRVLLCAAILGTLLALPFLEAVLYLMTGVRT